MAKLDVRNFSNIFNKSITNYAKFNWLSNGLPDGEYNGIKKVTVSVDDLQIYTPNVTAFISDFPAIKVSSNSAAWTYGFSNYEIKSYESIRPIEADTAIAFHTDNSLNIRVKGLMTLEEYKTYLKEHPLIIYYYDKNDWSGVIISSMQQYQNYCLYSSSKDLDLIAGIKDVNGEYAFIGSVDGTPASFNTPDKTIATNEIAHQNIIWQDYDYKPYSNNLTDFITDKLPRAIVYKLTATQSLSMQSEDESQTTCQEQ